MVRAGRGLGGSGRSLPGGLGSLWDTVPKAWELEFPSTSTVPNLRNEKGILAYLLLSRGLGYSGLCTFVWKRTAHLHLSCMVQG